MKSKALVSVSLIHALLKYAESLDVDVTVLFAAAGLSVTDFNSPEARIPAAQFTALWKNLADKIDDPHIGLYFAENSRAQSAGDVLTAVMYNCSTVGDAMQKLARYHDLTTDLVQIKIHSNADHTVYTWESLIHELPNNRHLSEAVICWLFFALKNLSQSAPPIAEIHFRHPEPSNSSEHQRIFECPVKFSQTRNQIIFYNQGLAAPIPLANPRLLQRLEAIVQDQLNELYAADTWAERVAQLVSEMLLNDQKPDVGAVANKLAVSARHLQNKLKDEGATYRELYDQVRKEMAMRYLREPEVSMYDTAFLLGFSDQSAFNHAFKRWTGKSPTEFLEMN